MEEAEVIINGKKLTTAQVMTVRVALTSFAIELKEEGLGDDETGKQLADGYIRACNAVLKLMFDKGVNK